MTVFFFISGRNITNEKKMLFAPDNKVITCPKLSGQLQNQAQASQWPVDWSVDRTE